MLNLSHGRRGRDRAGGGGSVCAPAPPFMSFQTEKKGIINNLSTSSRSHSGMNFIFGAK